MSISIFPYCYDYFIHLTENGLLHHKTICIHNLDLQTYILLTNLYINLLEKRKQI